MAHCSKKHNERSEAIELIKLMDALVRRNTWQIKSVGGESTINTGAQRMFPDLIMYGDSERTQILQGWEIKMPDTAITDAVFIYDAQRKAEVLGVNSCYIWNFTYGVLYVKDAEGLWNIHKQWAGTKHIKTRADVVRYKKDWELEISGILEELNGFFTAGALRPARLGDIVSGTIFTAILWRNQGLTADHIRQASVANTVIQSSISQWWKIVEKEYKFDENDPFQAYAKFVLLNWVTKISFANMIKGNHNPAAAVESITEKMSPRAALDIFAAITSQCDFFNIFEAVEYADLLPRNAWLDLTDYNAFLANNGIAGIPQDALQAVLENSVNQFKRSVSGLYTTPPRLAEILVKSGLTDLTAASLDPCCGTGTIAKEILAEKEQALGVDAAYATTYAADKFSFALQTANLAMTRANAMNVPSLLFRSNAFDLCPGWEFTITSPQSGEQILKTLPEIGAIVSNLPFVAFDQEGKEEAGFINQVIERVKNDSRIKLSRRADLYQALLLHLHSILADQADVAVITSNSWLGTMSGHNFFRALNFYYSVESIVTSGKGKWFNNADVITLMLFLKKKTSAQPPNDKHTIHFGLLHKELPELSDTDTAQIVDSIRLKKTLSPELLSFRQYTHRQIHDVMGMNLALNACFYDIEWLRNIRANLCPVTHLFDVFRGMKTGQDEIYYLHTIEDIDSEYVGRIFKSAKSSRTLFARPDTFSFVCDKTMAELDELGHQKTRTWIEHFKDHLNKSVINQDEFWMNLSGNRLSGSEKVRLFTGMNPEQRIFYGLLNEPAQINQRAIGFKPRNGDVNLELCHALLNSVVGVFYTEATGFPKGLGALDNCAENSKKILMLDPRRLSGHKTGTILAAFRPLLSRKIMATGDEYKQEDRIAFERVVAGCFGYLDLYERIRDSVLDMQKVRLSVKKRKGKVLQ